MPGPSLDLIKRKLKKVLLQGKETDKLKHRNTAQQAQNLKLSFDKTETIAQLLNRRKPMITCVSSKALYESNDVTRLALLDT